MALAVAAEPLPVAVPPVVAVLRLDAPDATELTTPPTELVALATTLLRLPAIPLTNPLAELAKLPASSVAELARLPAPEATLLAAERALLA